MQRPILMWLSLLLVSAPLFADDIDDAADALARGDAVRAVQILNELSSAGNTTAMVHLASLYQRGEGVDRDIDKAVALYRSAAELGDAEAQFNLGNMYLLGEGLPRDEDWALTFYRRAAAQGHVLAEQNMLELYRANGIDSPVAYPQVIGGEAAVIESTDVVAPPVAADLPPASQGDAPVAELEVPGSAPDEAPMITLEAVDAPVETPFDPPSADEIEALRLAQEHGIEIELAEGAASMPAMVEPAVTIAAESSLQREWLERLEGAKRALALENYEHGINRLTRLAEDGYGEAALLLADMAERGEGMPADAGLAMMWRQRAAALGSAEAQYQLAERYLRGDGLDPDDAMAITYYREAARGGHPKAQEKLRSIYADAGLPMPDFTRPREPITIDSTTTSARESTVEPSSTPDSVVVHATDGSVTGDEGASASALPPDGVERVPVSAEVTVEHSAHESMAEARTVELLQPAKRLSKPDPVTESSSLTVPATPRVRVVSPGVIVTHPPAHAPLVSESRLVLEPAKPENHEVVPGSMLKIGRGPVVAGQEPASSDDTIVVAPVAMVDTTVATEDEFDTLTEIDVAESVAIESMAQAENTAPNDPVTSVDVSGSASTAGERMAMASPQTAAAVTSLPVPAASGLNSAVSSSAPGSKGIFGRIKGFFSRDSDPVSPVTSAVGGGIAAKSDASMAPDPKAPDDGAPSLVHIGPVPEAKLDPGAVASITTIDDGKRALAEGRFASAAELFTRLAEQGNAEAQAHLGYMYYTGEGVESNLGKAVEMYRRAAVQGNRDAQYNLAVAYAFGEGVAQDDAEAVIWYRRAAEQGSAIAQYSLGVSYALGEGLMRDDREAIKWYRAAAEQGYAAAQYNLGYSYRSGHGIEADDIEALQWFEAAARNGHASAQYSVGYMYRSGRGVSRNLDEAVKWYRLAAAQGHPDARADLASLNPRGF